MNKRIDEIYSSSAGRQVLGSIIQKPELLKTHQLQASDFVDAPNQIIFMAIDYIARSGATQIDPFEVGEYLKQNYSYFYKVFEKHNGIEFLKNVAALSKPENFEYYYTELKRYTVLRVASQMGFDVSEFCDPDEIDLELEEKKRKFLEEFNPSGLVQYFETKVSELRDKAGVASVSDLNFYRISNLPLSQAEDKYLIQDFMLENTFNSIIAAAKVGKSQLAYQMAFCVQNGIDFLQYPVQKGDVLYVDFELRPNAIKKRFERLKEFYGLPDAEEYKVLSLADSYGEGSISLESVVEAVRGEKRRNPGIKLCIFDCYYSFCEGDSNAEGDTKRTLGKIKVLTKDMAVVYVHHTNKTGFQDSTAAIYAAGGSGVHGKIVDETYVIKPRANNTVTIINTGRDWSGREIPCIKNEDTLWFYQVDDAEKQALDERRMIGGKPIKPKITREKLREQYPDICDYIEKNQEDRYGVPLLKVQAQFPGEDTKSLKEKGFYFTGKNKRKDDIPTGRIMLPLE